MPASPAAAASPVARDTTPLFSRDARWPWAVPVVIALTAVGIALRVVVAGDALFADEYSTFWIVTTHSLPGVLSTVHSNAEITPPLYFVLSWATAKLGHDPILLRLPSLVAGAVTIPAVYALGLRTVGRAAALVATALTALAPFMIYYSAEARGYALVMALVVGSTLAMLLALDSGRRRWWVAYAACSCAAAYTHYTCFFPLLVQLVWLLWAHPEARRAAVLANVAAAVAFLPWITGLHNDLTSPTSKILSALSPVNADTVRVAFEHWSVGYPYAVLGLGRLPGDIPLVALAIGVALAVVGAVLGRRRAHRRRVTSGNDRLLLVLVLAASAPVGELLVSAVGTNLFGVRNLAPSWPALALAVAALLVAAGPRLRLVAVPLAIVPFLVGAIKMLDRGYQRPDYLSAAAFIDADATPRDVIVDETGVLSPGPLTAMDATLHHPHPLVRSGAPAEHDHPFGVTDPVIPGPSALARAAALAHGARIFVVGHVFPAAALPSQRREALRAAGPPPPYRLVETRIYPAFVSPVQVRVYAAR